MIDAEAMLCTLMARGERQVCAMVRPPSREAEDARRLNREREALLAERIRHANRIKGLLATQGVSGFEPTLRDRRARLAAVRTPEERRCRPGFWPRSVARADFVDVWRIAGAGGRCGGSHATALLG